MVGFELAKGARQEPTPAVALIDDAKAPELFAWLQTYSAESFPISQYCRVESHRDWEAMITAVAVPRLFNTSAWAAVIAGEMLANGQSTLQIKSIPLSWAAGCFSFSMARAFRLASGGEEGVRRAAGRLRLLEGDARFARRRLTVDMLAPVWSLVSAGLSMEGDLWDAVMAVLSAVDERLAAILAGTGSLRSNSAEQRIHGFEEAVAQVMALHRLEDSGVRAGAALAAAALVAGGGTSHVDLLRPFMTQWPECLPWFGLLSGLVGPKVWDSDWLRLVKGVERQVRGRFDLTDPPQGDLCWIEFDWIRQIGKAPGLFSSLPKHYNRHLTVEIAPGVTCQLRLAEGSSAGETAAGRPLESAEAVAIRSRVTPPVDHSGSTPALIGQLAELSDQLAALVRAMSPSDGTLDGQGALFSVRQTTRPAKSAAGKAKKARPKP